MAREMGALRRRSVLHCFPAVDLCHASYTATSESLILVAIPPAVDGALDKPALAPEDGIEVGQCPTNSVTLRLVYLAVTAVFLLGATRARIHAVFGLELLWETFSIN